MRNTPLTQIEGRVVPLLRANIDTDAISPSRNKISPTMTDFSACLFSEWRFHPDGTEKPDFALNESARRGSVFLIALDNFGCGSSRETAPWALRDFGFRCIIAPSFGSIFLNNCCRNGIAPIVLRREDVEYLGAAAQSNPSFELQLDMPAQTLVAPEGFSRAFEFDPANKKMLVDGLDPVGVTLLRRLEIEKFRHFDCKRRPWAYAAAPS